MTRRLLTPWGGALVFVLIVGLVIGGLGWVTVAALRVEEAQQQAAARADAVNKERLALWQLDSRMFPTLGVENNRPFAHYFALHIPYPVVLPLGNSTAEPVQVPSPLLSADLPDWMLLHVQIDPQAGWSSPQVIGTELEEKLRSQTDDEQALRNATPERQDLLKKLRELFPTSEVYETLAEREKAFTNADDSPLAVPLFSDPPSTPSAPVPAADGAAASRSAKLPSEPQPYHFEHGRARGSETELRVQPKSEPEWAPTSPGAKGSTAQAGAGGRAVGNGNQGLGAQAGAGPGGALPTPTTQAPAAAAPPGDQTTNAQKQSQIGPPAPNSVTMNRGGTKQSLELNLPNSEYSRRMGTGERGI
jgi:hypothetical protein